MEVIWIKSLTLLSGPRFAQTKEMEVWGLKTFLFSIGPYYVSGFGASQMKMMPYGGMSFAGNLGRNEEAGSLVLLKVLMGQVFGRRLERNRIQSFPMSFSLWGMVEGCASGRMFGVERRLFVILFPPCMLWLTTRRCWWLICGTLLGRKEDRSFNDWELDEMLSLLNTIQGKQIIESQEDLMFFKETKWEFFGEASLQGYGSI